jgi:hypothetical protein
MLVTYPHYLDTYKFLKLLRFVTWRAFSFWNVISLITDSILLAAFILRVLGINGHGESSLRLRSFQVLSYAAPFIW